MARLNENQIKFCEAYVANDFNAKLAYKLVYPDAKDTTASSNSHNMLKDVRILEKIKEIEGDYRVIGHKVGIDKIAILNRLKDLLFAKKQVFHNGVVIGEVNDNAASNKAIETILKIYGDFSPDKKDLKVLFDEDDADFSKLTMAEREAKKKELLSSL
jgi:hypothetical protein